MDAPAPVLPVMDSSTTTTGNGGQNLTWNHDSEGNHRYVIVAVSWQSGETIQNVTYGSTRMTLIGSANNNDVRISMHGLLAPPTGSQTITVSFTDPVGSVVGGAISFTNVDQTTPLAGFVNTMGTGPGVTLGVTSRTNALVMDTIATGMAPSGLTPGPSQTSTWILQQNNVWGAASLNPGATSITMRWTENTNPDTFAIGAVSIQGG